MATKVLDLELRNLPPEITGLEGYQNTLILIRLNGRPIGRAYMRIKDGRLEGGELRETLMQNVGMYLWERWLHDFLGVDELPSTIAANCTATIAVCTRDRTEDLQRCLEALMRLPDDGQEILVVDNCPSNEATRQLVANYPRIRYVREDRPGLSCARNRAMREARHAVVAFTDDDAVVDPQWLRALLRNFDDPLVWCVTGLAMPLELENEVQERFENLSGFSSRGFKRTVFHAFTHNPLVVGKVGAGVSMALRRSVFDRLGPFDETLGAGAPTKAGEDNEMFSRILRAGYRLVYDPDALCWHRHRSTWEALRNTLYGYGVGIYALWMRHLLVDKEPGVLELAWEWFRHEQWPALRRSFKQRKQKGVSEFDLNLAQLRGCLAGPRAYFAARKLLRN